MSMSKLLCGAMALLGSVQLLACSSSSSDDGAAATCVGHTSSAASTVAAKPVSFQNEVLPIFNASCAFGSCHGSPTGTNNGIYLGARGAADASAIRQALVGKGPEHLPSMKFVTPFQPESSYLLKKLEGDFCGMESCADGKCGERMPRGGDPLDPAALATVQAWIAQGAK